MSLQIGQAEGTAGSGVGPQFMTHYKHIFFVMIFSCLSCYGFFFFHPDLFFHNVPSQYLDDMHEMHMVMQT